jgi:hypothetical protein
MAAADYWALEVGIKAALDAALPSQQSPTPTVTIEEEFKPVDSWIGIFAVSRAAPSDVQSLSAGTKTRFIVRIELWCWRFGMSRPDAMRLRDSLVGDTELALMVDRTFGGACSTSWLEGGQMMVQDDPASGRFLAGGSIILIADMTATTT